MIVKEDLFYMTTFNSSLHMAINNATPQIRLIDVTATPSVNPCSTGTAFEYKWIKYNISIRQANPGMTKGSNARTRLHSQT